jgi:hypothetical protein
MKTDAEWQAILDTPTSLQPAIPVIAPVPLASLRSLLDLAAQDWPTLDAPGARVAWAVDARGVSVAATLSIHDWDGRLLGRRTYDGQWEVGGSVTWSPGRMQD